MTDSTLQEHSSGATHQNTAALEPEELARFFVLRANAGDVEGLVALYEPDAALAHADGKVAWLWAVDQPVASAEAA